jgi:sugar phosphate isomerase/epimerase
VSGSPWPLSYCTLDRSPLFGLPETLHEQVDAAAACGFAHVTPDMFALRALRDAGGSLDELRNHAARVGVSFFDVAGTNISADPEASAAEAAELAGFAAALDAPWLQARITAPLDDPQTLATYRRCADIAADAGCALALEFSPFTPVDSLTSARAMLDRLRDPRHRTGIVVDSWHLGFTDGVEALRRLPAEDLAFVQLSDAPEGTSATIADTMHHRCLPGEGVLDLAGFAAALRHIGFEGVVTIEVLSGELRTLATQQYAQRTYDSTVSVLRA